MESLRKLFANKSTVSETVREQVLKTIIEAAHEGRIGRDFFPLYRLTAGNTLTLLFADKDSTAAVEIAPGADIPIDYETYTEATIPCYKYGYRPVITSEMVDDAQWDLIERNLKAAGWAMTKKENALVVAQLAAGAAASTAGAFSSTGTELGIADITKGMRIIEAGDFGPNKMLIHPNQVEEIRNIDTFTEADKYGDRSMLQKGFIGKIFGMDIFRSTACTADKVYIVDSLFSGMFVERRPITINRYTDPIKDLVGLSLTARWGARYLRENSIVEITVQ